MQSLLSDLQYSARELRKRPGFALTAVLSLALGIGATSAVFSVIYAVLIDPFPYPAAERIADFRLIDKSGHLRYTGLNGSQIKRLRQANSLESVVAMDWWNLTTTDGDIPEDVQTNYITPNAPNHWGIAPLYGRWLVPSDAPFGEDPQPVVVLSYEFWQRYYLGDPNVVGRTIQLVHKPYQIVGIMPPRFKWGNAQLYLPLKLTENPNVYEGVSIKLKPGVTPAQVAAELQPIVEQFAVESPQNYPEHFRISVRNIIDTYARPLGTTLYLLLGAVASLLLIGCGNVSILLLARGAERQHELAVRAAIGANRSRMIRQLLTESLGIALAGAALGILIAWKSLPLLVAWMPNQIPSESVIKVNIPVLLFCVALAIITSVIFGLSPALQLSRPSVGRLMQGSGRRIAGSASAKRAHNVLIATQVALTILLLTIASAAGKGFMHILSAHLGYDPHNTMSVPIPIHENTYNDWQSRAQYFETIRARIATMPEVVEAGISTNATPPSSGNNRRIEIFGKGSAENPEALIHFVDFGYFSVLHIPLVEGRLWDRPEILRAAHFAVINQTMARQFWPNGNAIGQQIRIPDLKMRVANLKDGPNYSPSAPDPEGWLQIIGVVSDALNNGLRDPIKPAIFVPYSLQMRMFTQILVRTKVPPLSILHDIRAQLVQIDREQQVMTVRDLETWIKNEDTYSQQRFIATLFSVFAVLALVLAAVGLYSVVSYGVATRTNEFGIRMALGAKAADVFRLVLSSTAASVGSGLIIGLILSLAFSKLATRWVNETSRDPIILTVVTLLLVSAAVAASLAPARRAASTDPMTALRYE
jgi:putative ABC transport system permease protein